MHEREIIPAAFLVSSGDATATLEAVEETLDAIAYPVQALAPAMRLGMGRVRRDHRLHATSLHRHADPFRVVSRVTDEGPSLRVFKERLGNSRLVSLARRQLDVERPPFRVDDRMDFGGESTT